VNGCHHRYPIGSLKQHPGTLSTAVRTMHPDNSPFAWLVATVDRGPRYATDEEMSKWPDLLIGYSEYEADPQDYIW
jgi:hypothetical protein